VPAAAHSAAPRAGNWTNVVRIVPNSAVKFLTYEQLSRRVAAAAAGAAAPLPAREPEEA